MDRLFFIAPEGTMPDEEPLVPQTPEPPTAIEIEGFAVELAPDAEPIVAQTPPPVTPPVEPPVTPPVTPPASDLPPWLTEIPEAERVGVAERYLNSLTPEQRLQLPTVVGLVNAAYEQASTQATQQAQDDAAERSRADELYTEASTLYEDIINDRVPAEQMPDRLATYAEAAADTRQAELNEEIQESIWAAARATGVRTIPADVVGRAAQADGWGAALQVYQNYFLGAAYNAGIAHQKGQSESAEKADAAAERQRIRAEHLAELQTEGRLKEDAPPALGDGVQAPAGAFNAETYKQMLERGEQPSEEQINALGRQYAAMV